MSRTMYRVQETWEVGDYTFQRVQMKHSGEILYHFEIAGVKGHELYASLDNALVAAVGEKYTGRRGAGGPGVGTAADWFMKMIGAE